ncbi:MAG: rhomboid family intramembrane serine protease [Parasporobacterium sp.]|nr:rhomboid family intramembrane serine protease [Parasporobacterium sp.]
MIYNRIRDSLGQMNFAVAATTGNEAAILVNRVGDRDIFVVLLDNRKGNVYGAAHIQSIRLQLTKSYENGVYPDVLFVLVTNNLSRDKELSRLDSINLWLVDAYLNRLMIYENQITDFYGIRNTISLALRSGAGSVDTGSSYSTSYGSTASTASGYTSSGTAGTSRTSSAGRKMKAAVYNGFPIVTAVLVGLNVIIFFILQFGGNLNSTEYMLSRGANFWPYVFEDFQVWRLLTCTFMHFSLSHLAGNMIYLVVMGMNLERSIGRWRYLGIYLLSGIGSSLVSAAFYALTNQYTVSAGASGAVYGLIGAMLYLTFKQRSFTKSPQLFLRFGIIVVFLFYSNFVSSGVDVAAHVGGLFFGAGLTWLFCRKLFKRN